MAPDFAQQLDRQIRFIRNSCQLYDDGMLDEAIRLATSLRILFHTTKLSTSLLTHLKADTCHILSTALAVPGKCDAFALVDVRSIARIGDHPKAYAKLDTSGNRRTIPFLEWWQGERILQATFTRRDLVLWAANKDGGAHVDATLDDEYVRIVNGLGFGLTVIGTDEGEIPKKQQVTYDLLNLHFACLRQIAYEVLNSQDLTKLLPMTIKANPSD